VVAVFACAALFVFALDCAVFGRFEFVFVVVAGFAFMFVVAFSPAPVFVRALGGRSVCTAAFFAPEVVVAPGLFAFTLLLATPFLEVVATAGFAAITPAPLNSPGFAVAATAGVP
jgi:hypothetical protein